LHVGVRLLGFAEEYLRQEPILILVPHVLYDLSGYFRRILGIQCGYAYRDELSEDRQQLLKVHYLLLPRGGAHHDV